MRALAVILLALFFSGFPGSPVTAQDSERLYQEACDAGDMSACNVFGLMFETGEGVLQDRSRAARLYERACQGGLLVGCTNVGLLYRAGAGVARDSARAEGFFQVACEGGELLGCDFLREVRDRDPRVSPDGIATATERFSSTGRILDEANGEALDRAVVELPELGILEISDASGHFVLTGLPAGTHRLRAERLGYATLEDELEVPAESDLRILLTPDDVADLDSAGRIVGRVGEAAGGALAAVEARVLGQPEASALSNAQGRFLLRDVEPGLVEVRLTRLGYAPRTATLVVQPGRTVEVDVTMAAQPVEIDPIEVTVRSRFLESSGFYRRAQRGGGVHFTPQDLEFLAPMFVSDAVRRAPGVRIQHDPVSNRAFAISRRTRSVSLGGCPLPVYVDGVRMADFDLNQIPPQWLEAMEIYDGVNMPIEYQSGLNACGVVLLWTRR